jgi:hypothetical protein
MTTLPPPDAMEWTLGASAIVPSFKGCTFIIVMATDDSRDQVGEGSSALLKRVEVMDLTAIALLRMKSDTMLGMSGIIRLHSAKIQTMDERCFSR